MGTRFQTSARLGRVLLCWGSEQPAVALFPCADLAAAGAPGREGSRPSHAAAESRRSNSGSRYDIDSPRARRRLSLTEGETSTQKAARQGNGTTQEYRNQEVSNAGAPWRGEGSTPNARAAQVLTPHLGVGEWIPCRRRACAESRPARRPPAARGQALSQLAVAR